MTRTKRRTSTGTKPSDESRSAVTSVFVVESPAAEVGLPGRLREEEERRRRKARETPLRPQ